MTTYTTLPDASLAQDKPLTQSIARAFRDNPVAIGEGDSGAPRIAPSANAFAYFMAKRTTNQSTALGSGSTKVQCNTEDYDPDNLYDNVTNFRFTPNQAGLYIVNLYVEGINGGTAGTQMAANISKNGSSIAVMVSPQFAASTKNSSHATAIVQMNGSTDYLEGFVSFPGDVSGTCTLAAARFSAVAICEI